MVSKHITLLFLIIFVAGCLLGPLSTVRPSYENQTVNMSAGVSHAAYPLENYKPPERLKEYVAT